MVAETKSLITNVNSNTNLEDKQIKVKKINITDPTEMISRIRF
jgi:hypothetical protein